MDICASEKATLQKKHLTVKTPRLPLAPAEKNDGTTARPGIREVSSRYRSPSPSVPSSARRCPSPNATRTFPSSLVSVPRRAISAERKRPSTPSRPSNPSSPSTRAEALLVTKKLAGNKLPEGLWPSSMSSLSVSFQTDTLSRPVGKRDKPPPLALTDRALRPAANMTHKQGEMTPGSRKPTPERKRSPRNGKVFVDQSENSGPLDTLKARLVDHHRWPTRTGGKSSSTALTRNIDLSEKTNQPSSTPLGTGGVPSIRTLSLDRTGPPLQKISGDLLNLTSSGDNLRVGSGGHSLDDNLVEKMSPARSLSCSPSRIKPVSAYLSRGSSPSRLRPSTLSSSTTSVLSFIVDIKKGKKAANHIEDAHQLRLLYNRHVQWRYANAQAHAVLQSQKVQAERILYNVWRSISNMSDSLIAKRIELQQLTLKLKLYSVLSAQLAYLDQWVFIESAHTSTLSLAARDLQDCTLRLPVTCRARGDVESVKSVVRSAVDIMQAMGTSTCSLLSLVEGVNCLISQLADVVAQQRATLNECEALLTSTTILQVEEYSLRTNLIQLRQRLQLS